MRLTSVRRSLHSVPVTIFIVAVFFLVLWASIRDGNSATPPQSPRVRRLLLRKLLEYDHRFVPANDASFEYFGRWTPTSNQLRRDVSFPGSFVEIEIANTTSLFVSLRNIHKDVSAPDEPAKIDARQLFVQPARGDTRPSDAVSLLIQIDRGQILYFNQTGHDILAVSSTLDSTSSHSIKVMYLGALKAGGILEFEGIWLDKGGRTTTGPTHVANNYPLGPHSTATAPAPPPRKHFEVVTSLSYEDPAPAINSWPQSLASQFNTTYAVFPTSTYCITPTCPSSEILLGDLYFRSGPPGTSHFQLPYRFGTPYPAALILDIGLLEYQIFLAGSPSSHTINHFTTTFVQQYTTFISTIRSTAYPYHSLYITQQHGTLAVDASFTYNSAPSTLPIFLLTPFTSSRRLHRLLSHAISETVNALQAQGDKSTFWIDTSGWLGKNDFTYPSEAPKQEQQPKVEDSDRTNTTSSPTLTPQAHRKIASYLSDHLCPYLTTPIPSSATTSTNTTTPPASFLADTTPNNHCPFNRYDNYLGHLYVPDEASVSKMLEERKIELVKKFLGMEDVLH